VRRAKQHTIAGQISAQPSLQIATTLPIVPVPVLICDSKRTLNKLVTPWISSNSASFRRFSRNSLRALAQPLLRSFSNKVELRVSTLSSKYHTPTPHLPGTGSDWYASPSQDQSRARTSFMGLRRGTRALGVPTNPKSQTPTRPKRSEARTPVPRCASASTIPVPRTSAKNLGYSACVTSQTLPYGVD